MKISVLPLLGYVPFGMNSAVELPPFFWWRFRHKMVATAFSREVEAGRLPDSRSTTQI